MIPEAMSAWERFIHSDQSDRLVQLAIVHAEFEAIHPFLDGNGRLGRLLVPLFLCEKNVLARPNFYLSSYLERHRDEYYERLLNVSAHHDWTGWCAFFLTAIAAQAADNETKVRAILNLYQSEKEWITDATHSQYAIRALDWFFSRPIFKTADFVAGSGIPKPTANRILRVARADGHLTEIVPASGRRAAIVEYTGLLQITETPLAP